MKAFICGNTAVKDFVDNDYTRWLEKLTNIKLDMDIPPAA